MALMKKKDKIFGSDEVSVIGNKAYFEGTLNIEGSVRIDGELKGNITNCKSVIVGREGRVIGDIAASTVSVSGEVKGNVKATRFAELLAKSKVTGNVSANRVLVEEGAYFEGKCSMMTSEKAPEVSEAEQPA